MLNVVCLNAENYLGRGPEYVSKLHDMVRRNLAEGFEGRFICFTDDDPAVYGWMGIEVRPLPEPGLKGWWNKLALFKPGLFDDGDRILYFDLDTLITGRLDEIAKYDGDFAILRDFLNPSGMQSSVMAWRAGWFNSIWETWELSGRHEVEGGDQGIIEWWCQQYHTPDCLQEEFSDLFVSYKLIGGKIPNKASVVVFHGQPRPHEVTTGWVPEVWKIGGLTRADLDTICNTAMEKLFDNVRSNIKRDLPWLDYVEVHDRHAAIVGGGPSIEDKIDDIRWRQSLGQEVWALNGSAAWLHRHGIRVDYHVIADARPENAKFLAGARENTKHLIASQCDSTLFDMLGEHQVMLWHSNAPGIEDVLGDEKRPVWGIGGGSTVGLSAMTIASVLGYRFIHLYGYDSSVDGGEHHAYSQAPNDGDMIVDVLTEDGARFRAAPWMVQQAEEFCVLAGDLANQGVVITVAGEGLLPHLAYQMMINPPVHAADVRADAILRRLPDGPVRGAEIGVFAGDLSRRLLARPDLELVMVDSWAGDGASFRDKTDWHAKLSQASQDGYYATTREAVAYAGKRATIIRKESLEAARDIQDASLDFVFIDADHSYEACRDDIAAWLPKLKPGGLLAGHDYANREKFPHFDVEHAVDVFVTASGLTLDVGGNFTWFVRLPKNEREMLLRTNSPTEGLGSFDIPAHWSHSRTFDWASSPPSKEGLTQ